VAAELAIVIVNYRSGDDVLRALESVDATADGLELELVVVDNASGDGSADAIAAARPDVRLVRNESNRGFAAGVNSGFAAGSAEFVLVLNPDTIVEPGALRALVDHLRSYPDVGVAAPLLFHQDGSPQPNGYRRFPNLLTLFADFCVPVSYAFALLPVPHPHNLSPAALAAGPRVAHAYGAALAVRRRAFEQAGPFDEGFFLYLEETEWQERVGKAGWAIEIVPAARVVHLVRGGGESAEVPSEHYLESAYRWFKLHGVAAWRVDAVLLVATVLSQLAFVVIGLVPGKHEQSARRRHRWAGLTRWVLGRRRQPARCM
jgi:N-acetylglucosaminyl-diphospho-decaprenol L-rhamnosyltransferase